MKTFEALANAFVDEGTAHVFGLMGDRNQHWLNSLDKLGVTFLQVRHEGAALTMAEGWARVNHRPGVCTTTSGPGSTQLATALVAASRSHTPVVAFCGDTAWGNRDANQRFNQEAFAAATESAFVRVATPDCAYEAAQAAFYLARTESRPVVLSAPEDVQTSPFDDLQEYVPSSLLVPSVPVYPNPESVRVAVETIARSEHPVVIVGRGARAVGAGDAVLKLASRIGALIATSLQAMNWLRDRDDFHVGVSGLFSTRTAMELFQECDCVIGVGASLNLFTTEHGYLYPNAKYIHIDTNRHVVMGDGRLADCYIHGDARVGLELLDEQLDERSFHNVGYRTPEVKEQLISSFVDSRAFDIEEGSLDPRTVCQVVDAEIPEEFGFVLGVGNQSNFAPMAFVRSRPYTLSIKEFGPMGQGLSCAIGAIIGSNNAPGFLMDGDAGFMMHLAEFETAVRYDVPLLAIVMNDEALGAEFHSAKFHGMNEELALISTPDLGAVGVALGGRGKLVRSVDALRMAIVDFLREPGPMIIDVRISRSVLSVPVRRRQGDDEA